MWAFTEHRLLQSLCYLTLQGANHIRMTENTSSELITGCTAYAQLRLLTLHALAAAVLRRSRPAHL